MINLLQKAYNCYITYLDGLNYGRYSQNYCLLYDSILCLKNVITDEKYIQYFDNNLLCPERFTLNITEQMERIIAWDLSTSYTSNSFVWNDLIAPMLATYTFNTDAEVGLHFIYLAIPQDVNFIVYNSLGFILHDSTKPQTDPGQNFQLYGTAIMSNGSTNNVWRKNDPFDSGREIEFKIKIF